MAYIYKITNQINGKIYIGKTLKTIPERWKNHLKSLKRRECEKRPLYDAMNKYGVENFTIEEVEKCSPDILNDREVYWIEQYGSFKNGYNATKGGDGKHYIDYDLVISTYKQLENTVETGQILGINPKTVQYILKNYNIKAISSGELARKRSEQKPVAKCDKNTGKILEIYPSVGAAEKANGNSKHIGQVCKGTRKTCQGYKWKYI